MLRIGEPHNGSAMPIYAPFQRGKVRAAVEWISAPLVELEKRMAEGTLDASPISMIEYLRQRERYDLLPGISISSWGRTGNTVLYYRDSLAGAKEIAMPRRSPLGAALARWFVHSMVGVDPVMLEVEGEPSELIQRYPAVLVGDYEGFFYPMDNFGAVSLDIGEAWWQATQTPLVQTVWAVSKNVSDSDFEAITEYFSEAKDFIAECRADAVQRAVETTGMSEILIDGYLQLCNYDLTPAHLKGIEQLVQFLTPTSRVC